MLHIKDLLCLHVSSLLYASSDCTPTMENFMLTFFSLILLETRKVFHSMTNFMLSHEWKFYKSHNTICRKVFAYRHSKNFCLMFHVHERDAPDELGKIFDEEKYNLCFLSTRWENHVDMNACIKTNSKCVFTAIYLNRKSPNHLLDRKWVYLEAARENKKQLSTISLFNIL